MARPPASCPGCGSPDLDVRPRHPAARAAKVVAGAVSGAMVDLVSKVECMACGWKQEAGY